ncbi:Maf family protein [Pseudoflavonifractor capillosus]|uniref:dTTP/UTP pyrophosphatase n=1 Tax=Pseudoflavonifractor capillosus TaxID=106588 RepID=A0A921SSM3_9FIRM|nr:Maf family protein [Pseudoflavonifractor capillosus]HJG86633.1 Maf family protein [Pseudoflavonifractor capillosus]
MNIILASQSPRRKELLERMGIRDFETISPNVDESVFHGLPPEELVRRLSAEKAAAVAGRAGEDAIVIAADTVVALEGAVLGKPADELDAFKMLSALSGVRHQVYTGVTVCRGGEKQTAHEVTDVTFRELSEEEIEHYIATGEPMDKAGAYGIQGYGALLIQGISGDYYNVMGLPVCRLSGMLARFGVDCLKLAAQG